VTTPNSYLVCATQRSGSTLLVESLASTGVAGRPKEFFQYFSSSSLAPQPREWFAGVDDLEILALLDPSEPGTVDSRDFETWRRDILETGRTDNGVWGGKLMWNQFPLLVARTRIASGSSRGAVAELLGGDPLYVHVYREDVVPQAVSMWRAVQTRVWRDGHDSEFDAQRDAQAEYNARGIAHLAGILREQERQWRHWFAAEGIRPVEVGFRRLTRDSTAVTAEVLGLLGQDPALAPPPPLKPQSNGRSREWVERYRHDAEKNGYPR